MTHSLKLIGRYGIDDNIDKPKKRGIRKGMKKNVMLLMCFGLSLCLCSSSLSAAPWPGGHIRLGAGLQPSSGQSDVDLDSMRIGQLSLDVRPSLLPVYLALDISGDLETDGKVDLPAERADLTSKMLNLTLGLKWYQSIGVADLYAGLGATYLKTEQELKASTFVKKVSSDGLGATLILGFTDVQIMLPLVQWGVEFRYTKVNLDSIADVEPSQGAWLLTCGYGW
jgi:hypothetical protein